MNITVLEELEKLILINSNNKIKTDFKLKFIPK